jgi:hypothetical protein
MIQYLNLRRMNYVHLFHDNELRDVYRSPDVVVVMNNGLRWTGQVTRTLVRKFPVKRPQEQSSMEPLRSNDIGIHIPV